MAAGEGLAAVCLWRSSSIAVAGLAEELADGEGPPEDVAGWVIGALAGVAAGVGWVAWGGLVRGVCWAGSEVGGGVLLPIPKIK